MALTLLLTFIAISIVVLGAVAAGVRVVEASRKRQLSGMLRSVSAHAAEAVVTDILRPPDEAALPVGLGAGMLVSRCDRMIRQAGMKWTVMQLFGAITGAAIIGALIGMKIRFLLNGPLSMFALMALFGALPYLHVARRRVRRMREFEAQFPDALEFLARSMRAGHAFSVSLEMLAEEMPAPMSSEFRQVFTEQNLGMSIDVALKNLNERMPSVDVGFFVSAVMLQKETGGNLAEILTKLAYIIRERFRLRMKVRSASAHGRFTGTVLTIMPLFLMAALSVVMPDYLPSMTRDPIGRQLVVGAIISQFIGYFFIRKIVAIKV